MLTPEESAELRSLQERAYGRDGRLTPEELDRLHELESRRGTPGFSVADSSAGSGAESAAGAESGTRTELRTRAELRTRVQLRSQAVLDAAAGSDADAPPTTEPVEASDPQPRRRSRRWLAIAAGGAVLVGLGAGWMLWGWDSAQFALSVAHAEQRVELESTGDFDPGTVVAMSEQHGVVVWRAERHEGEEQCVIVTTQTAKQSGCAMLNDANMSSAYASITVPDGEELQGQSLSAYLLSSTSGEIVPTIQVWDDTGVVWESQYTEQELAAITRIEAEGFDPSSLGILGYDGETPVWTSWRPEGPCVIAESDHGIVHACADGVSPGTEMSVMADVHGVPTHYIVRNSEQRGQQLTIMKLPELLDAELDDPIEYEAG